MPNGPYVWSARAGRYRDAQGRFVSPAQVRAWLDQALDRERRTLLASARAFRASARGLADLAAFERVMRDGVKTTHLLAAMAAKGGYAQMTAADYGRVGATVRFHYGKLEQWMRQVADGTAPLDGRFVTRAAMYGGAALGTYYRVAGDAARAAGLTEEINVLGPTDHSCAVCVAQTALGPVPIGTLVPIGQRTCLGNCLCTIEFR
jgi:DNA-binding phage protein